MKSPYLIFGLALAFFASFTSFSFAQTPSDTLYLTACGRYWGGDQEPVKHVAFYAQLQSGVITGPIFQGIPATDSICSTLALPTDLLDDFTHLKIWASYYGPQPEILNGISVGDLICISRHILGLEMLPGFPAMLAADVNQSNSITTFDIVELRKALAGIYLEWPMATEIRVVPAACTGPNPANPFEPQTCDLFATDTLPSLAGDTIGFYVLKTGDADGDYAVDGNYLPGKGNDTMFLQLPKWNLAAGSDALVPVFTNDIRKITGLQFALGHDTTKITCNATVPGPHWLDPNAVWYHSDEPGLQKVIAFRSTEGVRDDTICFIPVHAIQDVYLPDVMYPDTHALRPFIVEKCGVLAPVKFTFEETSAVSGAGAGKLTVRPAYPNPFVDRTGIDVYLENAEPLRLQVFTLEGRLVHSSEFRLQSGLHRLEIPAAVLAHGSVGVWRLTVGQVVVTGRLVRK